MSLCLDLKNIPDILMNIALSYILQSFSVGHGGFKMSPKGCR